MTHEDEKTPSQLMAEVDKAIDDGRWDTVQALAKKILAIDSENADAIALLRIASRRLGKDFSREETAASSLGGADGASMDVDVFVGRTIELDHLKRAFHQISSGFGKVDLLAGEPGIGKTRLVEEYAAFARDNGARVLAGRSFEEGGTPAYWPWIQALRAYMTQVDAGELKRTLGQKASLVAAIFPEIVEHLPELPPFSWSDQGSESESLRFRIFDAVTSFFVDLSQSSPTVIVLEDLHWSDANTQRLLVHLVREMYRSRLHIICTYRDVELDRNHPLSGAIGELFREHFTMRHLLRRFSRDEVLSYIAAVTGIGSPGRLSQAVYDVTSGNPLFVSHLARLFTQDEEYVKLGHVDVSRLRDRMPEGVRQAIGARLNRLSADCNALLALAAIFGQEFDQKELIHARGDENGVHVLTALDEATRAGLIQRQSDTKGDYAFTHALVRQALLAEISLDETALLHARVVDSLEKLYGPKSCAERIAEHAARAVAVIDPEKVATYSLFAGNLAAESYAPEDALPYYDRGLSVLNLTEMNDLQASLMSGKAYAQRWLRYPIKAWSPLLDRVLDHYEHTDNVKEAINITLKTWREDGEDGIRRCIRVIKMAPKGSLEMGFALAQYASLSLSLTPADNHGWEHLEKALSIAEKYDNNKLKAIVHKYWARYAWSAMRTRESEAHALKSLEHSIKTNDLANRGGIYVSVIGHSLELHGRLNEAKESMKQLAGLMERIGYPINRDNAIHGSLLARMEADWDLVRMYTDEEIDREGNNAMPISFFHRIAAEFQTGHIEEGRRFIELFARIVRDDSVSSPAACSYWGAAIAEMSRVTGTTSAYDDEEDWIEYALESPKSHLCHQLCAFMALGTIAVVKGELLEAKKSYNRLVAIADGNEQSYPLYCHFEPYGEFFAMYCRASGFLDDAVDHLRKTRKVNGHNKPRYAMAGYDLADALLARDADGDSEEAKRILSETLALSIECTMPPLEKQVRTLQGKNQTSEASSYPHDLTRREVEVINLIVMGNQDKEIASALGISNSTVHNHVSNILRKTKTSNRTEAARYAVENGLVEKI